MDVGLAWACRETHGPAATPAAPAASFRKSRRDAFTCAGCTMLFPLVRDLDGGPSVVNAAGPDLVPWGHDPASGTGNRQEPPARGAPAGRDGPARLPWGTRTR